MCVAASDGRWITLPSLPYSPGNGFAPPAAGTYTLPTLTGTEAGVTADAWGVAADAWAPGATAIPAAMVPASADTAAAANRRLLILLIPSVNCAKATGYARKGPDRGWFSVSLRRRTEAEEPAVRGASGSPPAARPTTPAPGGSRTLIPPSVPSRRRRPLPRARPCQPR